MEVEGWLQLSNSPPESPPTERRPSEHGSDITCRSAEDESEPSSPIHAVDDSRSMPLLDSADHLDPNHVRFEGFEDEPRDTKPADDSVMLYGVEDRPPIVLAIIFGFQQVLLSINACVGLPVLIAPLICAGDLSLVKAELVSTFLVTSGISTFLQTTIGLRLPILQGGNFLILSAIASIMSVDYFQCPDLSHLTKNTSAMANMTFANSTFNSTINGTSAAVDRTEIWQTRMRELQGAIILSSLVQFILGASGVLNTMLRFIGPITVTPVIMLIGLALFDFGVNLMQKHWLVGFMTTFLLIVFSVFLREYKTPIISWSKAEGFHAVWVSTFKLFPIILSVVISWMVCGILTACDVFPSDPSNPAYSARTDAAMDGFTQAKWFFIPYPGQWGRPTIGLTAFLIMFITTIASMIESVGDYYACARVCKEMLPPRHAINRGLAVEGLVCILGGFYGSGVSMTSYSSNIGAIAITRVASRLCFQIGGLIFILCGVIGKLGAALAMIPEPVLGGLIFISFAFIVGTGLSNLTNVDLNSSRNVSILGISLILGLAIPNWLKQGNSFNTGDKQTDLMLNAFLSNAIFIGGLAAGLLDNLVPGTLEERGMASYDVKDEDSDDDEFHGSQSSRVYDLPYITPWLRQFKFFRYVPFLPTYDPEVFNIFGRCKKLKKKRQQNGLPKMVGLNGGPNLANSCDVYKLQGRRLSVKPDLAEESTWT